MTPKLSHLMGAILLASFLAAPRPASAQQKRSPEEVLAVAAENGNKVQAALKDYSCYAELTLETVSQADIITGKYYRFSQVSYDRQGSRQEKIFEEKNSLPKDIFIGSNAVNNLTRVYQFIITPETLKQYEFNYVGRESIDELNTYVFDLTPRIKMPDPDRSSDRYLRGRVWIDDQDLQVVKVEGEALPELKAERKPRFETYFQNHGKYWFPAYTSADDTIRVGHRNTRVVVNVRFTSYKRVNK